MSGPSTVVSKLNTAVTEQSPFVPPVRFIVFQVRDTGVGISAADQQRMQAGSR